MKFAVWMKYIITVILCISAIVFNPLHAQNTESGFSRIASPAAKLFVDGYTRLFPTEADGRVWVALQLDTNRCKAGQIFTNRQYSQYGNIVFLKLNRTELLNYSGYQCVQYADAYGRLNSLRLQNDTARVHSFVNEVHDGLNNGLPKSYKGKNVIVGIVDIGFQNDHPTFFNNDGTAYRVKRFWHQNDKSGTAPATFGYGTEYTTASAIQAAVDNDGTHGTHVAGISSGSGFTTPDLKFRGMAPESDMVFVTIKYTNDTLNGSALGDYVVANPTVIDGYKYIFNYAQSQGRPAVTNLSWGMHTGPHDGTSVFDLAVESLNAAGRIIVGANGNDAGHLMHTGAELNDDTVYTFAIDRNRNDYKRENVYCDFWGAANENLGINVSVFDTSGNMLMEDAFVYASSNTSFKRTLGNGSDSITYIVAAQAKYTNNNKPNILLIAESNNASKLRIRIGITGKGQFHAWNSGQAYRWTSGSFLNKVKGNDYSNEYLNGTENFSMSENGGTGRNTISVGSYVNRNNWYDWSGVYRAQSWLKAGEISGFSSRGPTADGRMKPDVGAPGQLVASAVNRNQFAGWMEDYTLYKSQFKGQTQLWTMFSGTSMAAPHAAGVIALMLEACPTLTTAQVKQILRITSTKDVFTGSDSNNNFGYGRINAFQGVKAALEINRAFVTRFDNQTRFMVFPSPADDKVILYNAVLHDKTIHAEIWDPTGRMVYSQNVLINTAGVGVADVSQLPPGTYIYSIIAENQKWKGRLLISR